jgi:glycosyltransferase involved in cell wall biosynthesis
LLSVAARGEAPGDSRGGGYRDWRLAQDYTRLPILRGLRTSAALSNALYETAADHDIMHNHGLWLLPNVQAGWAATRAGKPLVISPRGMLSPVSLQFSREKKRVFWHLLQGPAVRRASCLHATSVDEYDAIREFGLVNPIAIIPNGIDLPQPTGKPAGAGTERIVLSLGRIHPKKGLDQLLRAWATIEARYPGWQLQIAGPEEAGYTAELCMLARSLGLAQVVIDGPIYGDAKWATYRAADLFVLPTMNENFGLTVAEALAAETPAISTKGAPWSRLNNEGCGWWIDHGVEPLAAALETAMAMPREALRLMGIRGRAWMAREFSWDHVARDMLDVYRWLVHGREPPSTVRCH